MLSGDNGLLKRAGDARDDTVVGQEKEQVELAYISAAVKKLGDNVIADELQDELDLSVGDEKTDVSTNDDSTLNVYFTDTQHNYNVNNNGKVERYIKITVANAKSEGTIFTDNTLIYDDFGNNIKVPKGFKIATDSGTNVTEGIVIEDADTSRDTAESQFVWIPVGTIYENEEKTSTKTITLGRYIFDNSTGEETLIQGQTGTTYTATTGSSVVESYFYEFADDTESLAIKRNKYGNTKAKDITGYVESTLKNKGFYIARYEAGINVNTDQYTYASCTGENGSMIYGDSSKMFDKDGNIKPLSIKNKGVWNAITQKEAATVSRNMYNSENDKIKSDLVNSYAWDTTIVYIQLFGTNNSYSQRYDPNDELNNTGNNNDEQCKINDLSGNVFEWTTETNTHYHPCTHRGAVFYSSSSRTHSRAGIGVSIRGQDLGFRVILYL